MRAGRYFEGTGVLVIDRINGVAYVALSERADAKLAQVGGLRDALAPHFSQGAVAERSATPTLAPVRSATPPRRSAAAGWARSLPDAGVRLG